MKTFLNLIRIRHWIKNCFIFAPLFFSLHLFDYKLLIKSLIAFISFSFVASFVYIINDIKDRKKDSEHPVKSLRPIASGKINPALALILGAFLACIGIFGAFFINLSSIIIILIYLVMNIFYSFILKRLIILDVFIIAIGFCLRVLLGSTAIDVRLSHWMLLATFSISLVIGFGKRRHELKFLGDNASNHRNNLSSYSKKFLDIMIIISTAITGISYALYTMDPKVINYFGVESLIFTIPFVLYGLFRYLYIIYFKHKGGSPEDVVVTDPGIIITVILWLIAIFLQIYLRDKINFDFNFLRNIKFFNILN